MRSSKSLTLFSLSLIDFHWLPKDLVILTTSTLSTPSLFFFIMLGSDRRPGNLSLTKRMKAERREGLVAEGRGTRRCPKWYVRFLHLFPMVSPLYDYLFIFYTKRTLWDSQSFPSAPLACQGLSFSFFGFFSFDDLVDEALDLLDTLVFGLVAFLVVVVLRALGEDEGEVASPRRCVAVEIVRKLVVAFTTCRFLPALLLAIVLKVGAERTDKRKRLAASILPFFLLTRSRCILSRL